MPDEDQEFLQRLLAAFHVEANEHIQAISQGLTELESDLPAEQRVKVVDRVFREAHSLKGASRAVDLKQVESVCQALEDVFADWRKAGRWAGPESLPVLHRAVDFLPTLLEPQRDTTMVVTESIRRAVLALKEMHAATVVSNVSKPAEPQSLPEFVSKPVEVEKPAPDQARDETRKVADTPDVAGHAAVPELRATPDTVRIPTAKLDSVLLQAEEMLTAKLSATRRIGELRELRNEIAALREKWADAEVLIRTSGKHTEAARSELLEHFAEEQSTRMQSLHKRLQNLVRAAEREDRAFRGMVDNLLEDTKRLIMLPFGTLMEGFPRLVRELAREEGKEVQLVMKGHDVEIDKRILEELKDPLVHILRNCVDHGIEMPDQRGGKPSRGTIEVIVSETGGNEVSLKINDDGCGIDAAKVKAAAVKSGKISADEARRLSEEEARQLIFRSDVSTSKMITEISGRGLGLAIAREKVLKLGGRISAGPRDGGGTSFRIRLPVTLATVRAVFVSAGGQSFGIPVRQIERVVNVSVTEIHMVEGHETIAIDHRVVPLVNLSDVLELSPGSTASAKRFPALVLGLNEARIAFRIDEIGVEQEVLVKPLGPPLRRVRNVAGATVLANGRASVLLHVPDLLKSATQTSPTAHELVAPSGAISAPEARKTRVLVAEDSITSRMLLKNILEAAGYLVSTTVDGAEALATVRTGNFNLVISDVDMPRMDGFDLTTAIRRDHRLANLPVVLVTARETREDRERGIDAGANAYIVKSNFDQSNLLDVIGRLI